MTLLALTLGIGLVIMLYVAIARHDRIVQLSEQIGELEANRNDANQHIAHLEMQRSRHIREAAVLLEHCWELEEENTYLRACAIHRKQVLAGSMLQMQMVNKFNRIIVRDGANAP